MKQELLELGPGDLVQTGFSPLPALPGGEVELIVGKVFEESGAINVTVLLFGVKIGTDVLMAKGDPPYWKGP